MMIDPEVHFHVIPRYSKPVEFHGKTFVDSDWPEATKRVAPELTLEMREAIERALQDAARKS